MLGRLWREISTLKPQVSDPRVPALAGGTECPSGYTRDSPPNRALWILHQALLFPIPSPCLCLAPTPVPYTSVPMDFSSPLLLSPSQLPHSYHGRVLSADAQHQPGPATFPSIAPEATRHLVTQLCSFLSLMASPQGHPYTYNHLPPPVKPYPPFPH